MQVELSVIIPVHNGSRVINKCIKRLVKQKKVDLEIILVENNSSDNSWNECSKLEKVYPNVFAYKINQTGTNRARIFGVQQSHGKWVTFMDQDDCLISSLAYFKMLSLINNERKQIDAAQFGNYIGYQNLPLRKNVNKILSEPIEVDLTNAAVFGGMLFWSKQRVVTPTVWSKIYRGSIIRQVLAASEFELYFCEDLFTNFQFFSSDEVKTIVCYPDAFYCWNRGGVSSGKEFGYKLLKEYIQIRPIIQSYMEERDASDMLNIMVLDMIYFFDNFLLEEGPTLRAQEIYKSHFLKSLHNSEAVKKLAYPEIKKFLSSNNVNELFETLSNDRC